MDLKLIVLVAIALSFSSVNCSNISENGNFKFHTKQSDIVHPKITNLSQNYTKQFTFGERVDGWSSRFGE